jgi:hypothetical protein
MKKLKHSGVDYTQHDDVVNSVFVLGSMEKE